MTLADVEKGSPAAEADFQRGIVITHFGGEGIQSLDRPAEQLADMKSGDTVSIVVFISERQRNVTFQQNVPVSLKSR